MLRVDVQRKNVPGIKSLSVRRMDIERGDLILGESKGFGLVEVVAEQRIEFMGIQSTRSSQTSRRLR